MRSEKSTRRIFKRRNELPLIGIGKVHGTIFRTEKPCSGKGFKLLFFPNSFETLPDIDERWNDLVFGAEDLGHPRTEVGSSDGDGWDIAGVPVVLVAEVKDGPEVGLIGRTD